MEIQFELYNGRVKGKFLGPTEEKPNRHMYYIDGKRKKGVTTALGIKDKSQALMSWQREMVIKELLSQLEAGEKITEKDLVSALYTSEKSKQKSADIGTAIHDWIENYIDHRISEKNKMPDMPDDANIQIGVTSFLEWESAHKVKFLWSEKILYSLKHDYIGKGDFAAKVDGLTCLCDIKTGNGMYNSVRAQTAAYAMADKEESKIKYDGRWAIRLTKETEKEYQDRMELKNKIKKILGKTESPIEPYQVFEAMYLDNDKKSMADDFDAFLNHWNLHDWDTRTDFWKIKNAK